MPKYYKLWNMSIIPALTMLLIFEQKVHDSHFEESFLESVVLSEISLQ